MVTPAEICGNTFLVTKLTIGSLTSRGNAAETGLPS